MPTMETKLSEKLKDNKISINEITEGCVEISRNRVAAYVNDPTSEKDVRVANEILESIEAILKKREDVRQANLNKLNSILNSSI